jgi:hypothetical protein
MPWSPAPRESSGSTDDPSRCSWALSTPCAISLDCSPTETLTPQEDPSKPVSLEVYPMPFTTWRTIVGMST